MVNLVTSTMKEGGGEAVNITDSNLPPYLSYSATYSDGKKIEKNHSLKSGKSEKYKVRIEFKKDITATQLPGAEKSFTFNFQVDYVQADDNAVDVQHAMYVYTKNVFDSEKSVWLNQPFPSTMNKFNSGSETGKNIYLKHKIEKISVYCFVGSDGYNSCKDDYTSYKTRNECIEAIGGESVVYNGVTYTCTTETQEFDSVTESYVEFVITDTLKTQLKGQECTDENYPDATE